MALKSLIDIFRSIDKEIRLIFIKTFGYVPDALIPRNNLHDSLSKCFICISK